MVLLFGGLGVYLLGAGLWGIIHRFNRDGANAAAEFVFILILAGLPLAVAWLAYLRQYRRLAKLAAGVGAFLLLGAVAHLIRRLGGNQWLGHFEGGPGWKDVLGMVLGSAPLVLTIVFCKWAMGVIDRYLPEPAPTAEQQARALRWQRRRLPVRRAMLLVGMALAELMVWAAVLAFLGTLMWVWEESSALARTDDLERDAFARGLIVLVASLLVFLVGWLVRGGWRSQLRALSASND